MPLELPPVSLADGQQIVVTGKAPLKAGFNATKTRVRITAAGTYVEPPPPIPPIPFNQWRVGYFPNTTLAGEAIRWEITPSAGADWAAFAPANVPLDDWSARYEGVFTFKDGVYDFRATSDDGVRVWVDGELLIDNWRDQGKTTVVKAKTMTAGDHPVKVEYYENSGLAILAVLWDRRVVDPPPPDPEPEPEPEPPPPGGTPPAFGSRPSAGRVGSSSTAFQLYRNATDVEISNRSFRNLGAGIESIRLEGCRNVWIHDCDFENVAQAITAWNSFDITIDHNRARNILGPHARTGRNLANFVQLAVTERIKILSNRVYGGDTEDVISVYKSPHAEVAYNHIEHPLPPDPLAWSSGSGSGIALCDGASFDNHAHHNVLVNPGQVGSFIAGGHDSDIEDNILIGDRRAGNNTAIYIANYSGSNGCQGNHAVRRNRWRWFKPDGTKGGLYLPASCPNTVSEGNVFDDTLRAENYHVDMNAPWGG